MTKRVSMTVEWDGCADEEAYANVMAASLEQGDRANLTRVVSFTPHTGLRAGTKLTPNTGLMYAVTLGLRLRMRRLIARALGSTPS